jgi:uncharacterized damage-inducible protein DinB
MNIRHLLVETYAYMPPANILADVSEAEAMRKVSQTVHSIAEIVAHIEFWQDWFLKRSRGEAIPMIQSAALGWPAASNEGWPALRERFLAGLNTAASLADDTQRLEQRIAPEIEFPPLGEYTLADVLVHIAAHNAHHLGQIITLRQLMGKWPPSSGSWTW